MNVILKKLKYHSLESSARLKVILYIDTSAKLIVSQYTIQLD